MMWLQALNKEQVEQVHQATLALLAQAGIKLAHAGARQMLLDRGATVEGDRVLLPARLVEECVSKCPHTVRLQGRDPESAIVLGMGAWYAHNVGGVPNVFENGTRRPARREDVKKTTTLLDQLPNVASVTPHFTPQDVPQEQMVPWMLYETIANTTKPIRAPGTQTSADIRILAEMADIAFPGTGRRGMTVGISPISPLTFPDNIVDAILETARLNMILGPLPCPISGATAPMSLVGGLAQQSAEVLASVVLAQLVSPGLPIIYKGRLSLMDPRTGLSVWGNPEVGIISAATVQIGHQYGLPVDVYGLSTNSHVLDIQNGYERAFTALLPVLAGADEISGVGEMDGGVNSSLTQMVIDNEVLSSVRRIRQGMGVDEDALAVPIVTSVLKGSGNFLAEKHTVRYLRKGEMLRTELAERADWSEWENKGRQGIVERAQARVDELLASPRDSFEPLTDRQRRAMLDLIKTSSIGDSTV